MTDKMTFRDYVWKTNPSELSLSDSRQLKQVLLPYRGTKTVDLGMSRRVISGRGEFVGEDAYLQYDDLHQLFQQGERGLLAAPGFSVFYALPYQLEVTRGSGENSISYRFSFLEG